LLGALVDDGALVARERRPVLLALKKILADLGPDFFQDEANMRRERIVAQHRVPRLNEIDSTDHRQGEEQNERHGDHRRWREIQLDQQSGGDDHYGRIGNKARAERQQQGTHGPLPVGKITVTSPPEARAGDIIRVKPVSFVRAPGPGDPGPLAAPGWLLAAFSEKWRAPSRWRGRFGPKCSHTGGARRDLAAMPWRL